MVGLLGGVGEIHRAPFDVEDTIGRSARYRGVNAAGATRVSCTANPAQIISSLVVPIRHDRVVVAEPRQADVGKVGSHGRELGIAVGRHIDAGERQVVQRVTEGKRNTGYHIIPVITAIRRAWYDAAADLTYYIMAAGCRRWRGSWGWSISRCRRRRGSWCWSRCRACRRRCAGRAASHGCLDPNRHRCSCLEEADHRTDSLRRLIRIKPEVIQRAEANRVGILI